MSIPSHRRELGIREWSALAAQDPSLSSHLTGGYAKRAQIAPHLAKKRDKAKDSSENPCQRLERYLEPVAADFDMISMQVGSFPTLSDMTFGQVSNLQNVAARRTL